MFMGAGPWYKLTEHPSDMPGTYYILHNQAGVSTPSPVPSVLCLGTGCLKIEYRVFEIRV